MDHDQTEKMSYILQILPEHSRIERGDVVRVTEACKSFRKVYNGESDSPLYQIPLFLEIDEKDPKKKVTEGTKCDFCRSEIAACEYPFRPFEGHPACKTCIRTKRDIKVISRTRAKKMFRVDDQDLLRIPRSSIFGFTYFREKDVAKYVSLTENPKQANSPESLERSKRRARKEENQKRRIFERKMARSERKDALIAECAALGVAPEYSHDDTLSFLNFGEGNAGKIAKDTLERKKRRLEVEAEFENVAVDPKLAFRYTWYLSSIRQAAYCYAESGNGNPISIASIARDTALRKHTFDAMLWDACGRTSDDKLGIMRGDELARAHIVRGEGDANTIVAEIAQIVARNEEWNRESGSRPRSYVPFYDLMRCIDYGDTTVVDMIKNCDRRHFLSKLYRMQGGYLRTDEDRVKEWLRAFDCIETALRSPDLPAGMKEEVSKLYHLV